VANFDGVLGGALNCGECKLGDPVFNGDTGCLQEIIVVVTVEEMFNGAFYNNDCHSMRLAIGVLGIVYGIVWYTYGAFAVKCVTEISIASKFWRQRYVSDSSVC
jgi:hypothetical protein